MLYHRSMKDNQRTKRVSHIGKYFSPYAGGIESVTCDLMDAAHHAGWETHALVHHHRRFKRASEKLGPHQINRSPIIGEVLFTPIAPLFWWDLHQALKAEPDLLHIHMPNVSAFWCLFSHQAKKRPWIIHWHSDVVVPGAPRALSIAYQAYRPFEQALLKRAEHIIVTNPNVLEASKALKPWRDKCMVIPLAIPDSQSSTAETSGSEPLPQRRPLQLLTVGRLSVYKGHCFFLEVLAALKQRGVAFDWHVVGTGTEEPRIKERIGGLKLDEQVTFHGNLSESALAQAYAQCDVFVLPSDSALEAFGVVLLEAMRAAKPCIVQNVAGSGMSWVVANGKTGVVVPLHDKDAWIDALTDASVNPKKWRNYGESGRQRFLTQFSPEAVGESLSHLMDFSA